jgi:hypothetical protein
MACYTLGFLFGIGWVLSMIVPEDTHEGVRLALGVFLVVGSIVIGYLIAFEKPLDTECRPAGPAIYNGC